MPFAVAITRIARRTLDILLVVLIGIVLATLIIARLVPALSGGTSFVVGGGSMEPVIPLGAAIVATPVGADSLVVGDIVSLKVGVKQSVFTHRITRLVERDGATWLATKGDANASPDPSLIPATAVIGRVTVIVPWAGYFITLLGSLQGIIFLVSLGVFVLAGAWFLETIEDDLGEALRRRAGAGLGPLVPGVREPASEPGAAG